MSTEGFARAQFEYDRQEPAAGNIQVARMQKTAADLKASIRELENEREALAELDLQHLAADLKAQVFENYDNEISNRRQELADVRQNLSARGYIV